MNLEDNFPYAQLFSVQIDDEYFTDIIQYLSIGTALQEYNTMQKKNLVVHVANYQLIEDTYTIWAHIASCAGMC
jgi:hypothetical protein